MKYILITGTKDAGKSTTIDAVCKRLNPSVVQRLTADRTFEKVDPTIDFLNGTYIIEIKGKIILVVAGAPTEQNIQITILIKICIELKIKIDFALVSKRTFERIENFDTVNELKNFGECLLEERINRVSEDNFEESEEWKSRIEKICKLVKTTLQL
ncbi:MAG: hypothetical protein JWO09_862 [Bacteroidetes bacterium]|nr:hypothetical protein [Bacteroidota bacterium]